MDEKVPPPHRFYRRMGEGTGNRKRKVNREYEVFSLETLEGYTAFGPHGGCHKSGGSS
jgi:hypothetical protein